MDSFSCAPDTPIAAAAYAIVHVRQSGRSMRVHDVLLIALVIVGIGFLAAVVGLCSLVAIYFLEGAPYERQQKLQKPTPIP